jgi:hypothetical protein
MTRPTQAACGRLAAATVVAATLAVTAPAAHAATQKELSLTSGQSAITTTTGKKLYTFVEAFKTTTSGATDRVTFRLHLGTRASDPMESHLWQFSLSRSSFTYSSGKATLATGSQISPYGSVKLTFTKTSQSSHRCGAGTATVVHGSLKGIVHFATNAKNWGTAGSSTKTFTFATPNTIEIDSGCTSSPTPLCFAGTAWWGPLGTHFEASGFAGTTGSVTSSTMQSLRTAFLSKPSGAIREDAVVVNAPKPSYSSGVLTITTASSGAAAGRAKLKVSGTPQKSTFACKSGSSIKHETRRYYSNATWTSPSSNPLRFHAQIEGSMTQPTSGSGQVQFSSVS